MPIFRKKYLFFTTVFLLGIFLSALNLQAALWDKLSSDETRILNSFLKKKEPMAKELAAKGTLPILTFKQLEEGLTAEERQFIQRFLKIKPKDYGIKMTFHGYAPENIKLSRLSGQKIKSVDGKKMTLPVQYLPQNVYDSYHGMMKQMEKDIGRRLYVESGFRSAACQLYNFLYWLKRHDGSISETIALNAIPGYSEHGSPWAQAIDFITADGINGDGHPPAFTSRAEYKWLLKNAGRFGFVLSYPENNWQGLAFEPWHWRYNRAYSR